MITEESLRQLATRYQTGVFPNVVREYFQHVFLSELYKLPGSRDLLFKGGTALRVVYGSPRFSEDLDFSAFKVTERTVEKFVEDLFVAVLLAIERTGIRVAIGRKSEKTSGGYFGTADLQIQGYPSVGVEINVSARNGRDVRGEADSIVGDFVPTYTLMHLPQAEIVEEKIFGALRERKKPRDFYDLYFLMRKNMLSAEQKKRLKNIKEEIVMHAQSIDFRGELGAFLPADQQAIIRDFDKILEAEINRQIS